MGRIIVLGALVGIAAGLACYYVLKITGVATSPGVMGGIVGGVVGAIVPNLVSRKSKSSGGE